MEPNQERPGRLGTFSGAPAAGSGERNERRDGATSTPRGTILPDPYREQAGDHASVVDRVRSQYLEHPFPPPRRRHSYREHARFVRRFLEDLGIDPAGRRFGDIACGTGLMLVDLASELREASFVGYDLSPASVARADSALAEEGLTNARVFEADLLELDGIAPFDYLISWGTVHHLAEPRQGVEALARLVSPGGVLHLGVYGHYGNWERRLRQEVVATLGEGLGVEERIEIVRELGATDPAFASTQTAPPVDLADAAWIVDEYLHVWERPIVLGELAGWLRDADMEVLALTDYYCQPIALDPAEHLRSPELAKRAGQLSFERRCHLVELLVRPYWLSVLARKVHHG